MSLYPPYSGISLLGWGGGICYLGLVEQLYRYTNRASHDGRLCVTTVFVSRLGVLVPANELELVMEVFLPYLT